MDAVVLERRRQRALRVWFAFVGVVPATVLLGEVFRGALSATLVWSDLLQPATIMVVVGIVLLRIARRVLLAEPTPNPRAEKLREGWMAGAFRFLFLAWTLAALITLCGLLFLWAGAPARFAYVFVAIGTIYYFLYYPRRAFIQH